MKDDSQYIDIVFCQDDGGAGLKDDSQYIDIVFCQDDGGAGLKDDSQYIDIVFCQDDGGAGLKDDSQYIDARSTPADHDNTYDSLRRSTKEDMPYEQLSQMRY